jgi:uncharacterized protein YbjT (DUF2867 family)
LRVLLTGATGYIGKRLGQKLLNDENVKLRLFARSAKKVMENFERRAEVFEGDTFNVESLKRALEGIDVAYYLIHSMSSGSDFDKLDRISARNFRDACADAGVRRIIYLGGLGSEETASKHLLSRIEVGEILSSMPDNVQTIWFRAGVIIGSGSVGFEIIRNLVKKLPVMTPPKWVSTITQPIAINDVLYYLTLAKDLQIEGNLVVDIGADRMSFQEMLLETAKVMGLKRVLIPIPLLSPKLSSYWFVFITKIPLSITSSIIDGLRSETVLQNDNASKFFPSIEPMSYREAVMRAISEMNDK